MTERADLLKCMNTLFSKEEIHTLCFNLGIDHENLVGKTKMAQIRELINTLLRQGRLLSLIDKVAIERPVGCLDVPWRIVRQDMEVIQKEYLQPTTATPTSSILSPPFQVPRRVDYFTGRLDEVTQLKKHLTTEGGNPIVGLVGLGGVGKTAVAIQVAHELKTHFTDGILWADLSSSTPEAELISFAGVFGQAEAVSQQLDLPNKAEFVRRILADKHILIIINQVQERKQLEHLLPSGPKNYTLIITRNGRIFTHLKVTEQRIRSFSRVEALTYLERIVGQTRIQAELEAANQIINQTGRLPLALSIVAGFLKETDDLTLVEYANLLQDETTRLENLADEEDSNRDVAASFELSYQFLSSKFQHLFASLSIFDGPDFSYEAVDAILPMSSTHTKIGLGRLFRLSLIGDGLGERDTPIPVEAEETGRYRLNPLIKVFARQKLGDQANQLRAKAATYFIHLAAQNSQPDNYVILDLEWQNIMDCLQWAYENQEWALLSQGILALTQNHLGMIGFMDARGHWHEARRYLSNALEGIDRLNDLPNKTALLVNLAGFAVRQADYEAAEIYLQDSLALIKQLPPGPDTILLQLYHGHHMTQVLSHQGDKKSVTWLNDRVQQFNKNETERVKHEYGYLYTQLASMLGRIGRLPEAATAAKKGLSLLPDSANAARVSGLKILGNIYSLKGNLTEGTSYFEKAIDLAEAQHNYYQLAILWANMGNNYRRQGNFWQSIDQFQKSLDLHRYMGDKYHQTRVQINLATVYIKLGEDNQAEDLLNKALHQAQTHKIQENEARALTQLADLRLLQAETAVAEDLLNQAAELVTQRTRTYLQSTINRLQAKVALAQKELEKALEYIEQAVVLARETEEIIEKGMALHIKATILSRMKSLEATAVFQQSLDILEDADIYAHARVQVALAQHLYQNNSQNSQSQISQLLYHAYIIFTCLGAKRDLRQTQTLIKNYGLDVSSLLPMVSLTLAVDFNQFTLNKQNQFIMTLSEITNIKVDDISIIDMVSGSVKLILEMSEEAAITLISMYLANHPQLKGLEIITCKLIPDSKKNIIAKRPIKCINNGRLIEEKDINLAKLRQFLVGYFDPPELREICFDLEVDDSISAQLSKRDMAIELISYLQRRGLLSQLVSICCQERPHLDIIALIKN